MSNFYEHGATGWKGFLYYILLLMGVGLFLFALKGAGCNFPEEQDSKSRAIGKMLVEAERYRGYK